MCVGAVGYHGEGGHHDHTYILTTHTDPHMRGFDGRSFEFQGFHGGFFTLLTHARNEVNVLLDNLHHHDATFITAVGLVHPGHRIAARIDNGIVFWGGAMKRWCTRLLLLLLMMIDYGSHAPF